MKKDADPSVQPADSLLPLDKIVINEELEQRASREPNYQVEADALRRLANELSQSPETILQRLVEMAASLTGVESAGISIAEECPSEGKVFRWYAVTGRFASFLHATLPRHFSPCGVVLDENRAQLMLDPERHFGYIQRLEVPIAELLLVPFHRAGVTVGTIWVVSHDPEKKFDREDSRLLHSLAEFTAAAAQSHSQRKWQLRSEAALAEERSKLTVLFRETPAALALLKGPELTFEMINPVYQALFPDREILGKPLLEAVPELEGQPYVQHLRNVRDTGEEYFQREAPVRLALRTGGALVDRYFDLTYRAVRDKDGNPYGVYAHSLEVTERVHSQKRVEENAKVLAQTIEELKNERNLRENFVAALTHDLRTPLTAAKMNAQLLLRKSPEPAMLQKLASRISDSMDRADRMIRDLLDASRIKAGERVALALEECHLNAIVEEIVDDLAIVYGDRFSVEASSQIRGHWDCVAVRRMVENLAGNAVKYGAVGRPIRIWLRESGDAVEIGVHNEGNPIPPEDQSNLFEPYRRSESAKRSSQKGWGLGLTLVRGFAEAHGGAVQVRSSSLDGTVFSVRLPQDARPVYSI